MKTLVIGGVRSGKSAHAEKLLADADRVDYVAPGPMPDEGKDAEWAARIAAHRLRRPAHWRTIETTDVAAALWATANPVLVDSLGTWLSAHLDQLNAWTTTGWDGELRQRIFETAEAWAACEEDLVMVTNEVGWTLVSEHASGRLYTDWLGRINQLFAARCDEVHLVVAGRVLQL
ncbi:bifunctional adenosylcobinamide kinase/adenosylcobinamide-phosphate guanylyltransferase [Granulicoccus phenolivorans]|uniref:bifunctional adenosylcobinamide kinase/adenosylcobinamide-phosphate guanylyltransferase n=1 Tax=Granulicoccus phenolivorans TaxID=266854 RepID=UPI0003FC5807|nr:bifunctional adenosylcobinamide kinase/adenosylcobinamide-phosphate guanylyltransferase [Granulicoccus phenolivorans]